MGSYDGDMGRYGKRLLHDLGSISARSRLHRPRRPRAARRHRRVRAARWPAQRGCCLKPHSRDRCAARIPTPPSWGSPLSASVPGRLTRSPLSPVPLCLLPPSSPPPPPPPPSAVATTVLEACIAILGVISLVTAALVSRGSRLRRMAKRADGIEIRLARGLSIHSAVSADGSAGVEIRAGAAGPLSERAEK